MGAVGQVSLGAWSHTCSIANCFGDTVSRSNWMHTHSMQLVPKRSEDADHLAVAAPCCKCAEWQWHQYVLDLNTMGSTW